jgi:hypothetical protein
LVAGVSKVGKYSRPTPSLRVKVPEKATSAPLARTRPTLVRTSCVPRVPASTVTEPPSSEAPVRVMTFTTAKKALSP